MSRRLTTVVMAAGLALAGCGEKSADDVGSSLEGDLVPITHRAVAAVALEHLPADTTARKAMYTDQQTPKGTVGAELRYRGDGEYDGDYVGITVSSVSGASPCDDVADGCEKLKAADGSPMYLVWQELDPEEDPGIVYVVVVRKDESTAVGYAGPTIEGDPREQELPISVDDLVQVAQDPRLQPMTTPEAVEAGERLDDWEGGEPDPAAYDVVPSSDQALAAAYLFNRGAYGDFTRADASPLKSEFGTDPLGARLQGQGSPVPGSTDILASADGPEWLRGDPCASKRLPNCVVDDQPIEQLDGDARGKVVDLPLYLMWRPGEGGEVWAVQKRKDQVVAIRWAGIRVPRKREDVEYLINWPYGVRNTLGNSVLGLTTLKSVADSELPVRWQD